MLYSIRHFLFSPGRGPNTVALHEGRGIWEHLPVEFDDARTEKSVGLPVHLVTR